MKLGKDALLTGVTLPGHRAIILPRPGQGRLAGEKLPVPPEDWWAFHMMPLRMPYDAI